MAWLPLKTQHDADVLMRRFGGFHDGQSNSCSTP